VDEKGVNDCNNGVNSQPVMPEFTPCLSYNPPVVLAAAPVVFAFGPYRWAVIPTAGAPWMLASMLPTPFACFGAL
jgi:hypothetical protein